MPDWTQHEQLFVMLGVLSAVTFVGSLILMPILVARLPVDYFQYSRRRRQYAGDRHPVVHMVLVVSKNTLGLFLLLAGIAMLVLPGQGILTILIALALMDFPGKYRFEKALVRREPVFSALNWIRLKAGVPALLAPD